ncbi:hypothetical protein ACLRGI_05320 [Paenarthrobacter nitroguajacolicus]|uniref:hypothetical protein n=1 Tax=Paenarthrobacter nitroguajacolicus TaxID=211146 RepID=UPI003AEABBE5
MSEMQGTTRLLHAFKKPFDTSGLLCCIEGAMQPGNKTLGRQRTEANARELRDIRSAAGTLRPISADGTV